MRILLYIGTRANQHTFAETVGRNSHNFDKSATVICKVEERGKTLLEVSTMEAALRVYIIYELAVHRGARDGAGGHSWRAAAED